MATVVKVFSKTGNLPRQMPGGGVDGLSFTFDQQCRKYDWLAVYDDMNIGGKRACAEKLACPRQNTILVTHEPAAVKIHGADFVAQFHYVLSCHEAWALRHPRRKFLQPLSPWWYGINLSPPMNFEALQNMPPPQKTKTLSVICSDKRMRHTQHDRRYQFTQQLKARLPEMEWFGHGVRGIGDKKEAMDDYRYHIALENHLCPHYWTEKLADSFLAYCLPFYGGCPNAADYFPPESFITINTNDAAGAAETIKRAMENNEYEKRLPAIKEARRLLLERHNFFPVIVRFINEHRAENAAADADGGMLYSRRALISRSPMAAARYFLEKQRARLRFRRLGG